MDGRLLKNFIEIVECGNMTAASHKLFVAQPALSNQLRALERELGVRLLERTSRSQKLTDAGAAFYRRAKDILALENTAVKEARDCDQGERGCLRLGMTPSTAITLLDGLVAQFSRRWPQVRYELYELNSHELLQLLENGVVDVAVVRTPCHITPAMTARFISGERMVAAYHPDFFSFPDAHIPLSALEPLPIIIIRRYEELFESACIAQGLAPSLKCVNLQLAVSLKWAQNGLGVAIVPLSSLSALSDGESRLEYRIIDEPAFSTQRAIVTMTGRTPSAVCRHFLELCGRFFPGALPPEEAQRPRT